MGLRACPTALVVVLALTASAFAQPVTLPTVSGTVVYDADNTPVPGIAVFAFWVSRGGDMVDPRYSTLLEARTGADGSFTFPGGPTSDIPAPVDLDKSAFVAIAPEYDLVSGERWNGSAALAMRLRRTTAPLDERARELGANAGLLALSAGMNGMLRRPHLITVMDRQFELLPPDARKNVASLLPMADFIMADVGSAMRGEKASSAPALPGMPPPAYSGRAINARVVDATTGRPIDGVVVVADWRLTTWLRHGGTGQTLIFYRPETLSDSMGRLALPAWGPIPRPPITVLTGAPDLVLFKHGYEPLTLRAAVDTDGGPPDLSMRETLWDGTTIQLIPFAGTAATWLGRLSSAADHLGVSGPHSPPHYSRALGRERAFFDTPEGLQVPRGDVDRFFQGLPP